VGEASPVVALRMRSLERRRLKARVWDTSTPAAAAEGGVRGGSMGEPPPLLLAEVKAQATTCQASHSPGPLEPEWEQGGGGEGGKGAWVGRGAPLGEAPPRSPR